MSILHLLSNDNFIAVNKSIAGEVGLEAAVVLGELASEYNYWQSVGKLEEGYFYSTIENLEKKTYLSAYSQRQALAKLQEKGWISITKKGLPAKRYIKVNEGNLTMFFNDLSLKNLTTGDSDFEQQGIKKFNENKNINKENIEKENKDTSPLISPEEKLNLLFACFWKVYPKKANKKDAFKAFKGIKDIEKILPDIITDVEEKKQTKDWQKMNGQYIPYPASYLRGERWKDVNEVAEKQAKIDEIAAENIDLFLL